MKKTRMRMGKMQCPDCLGDVSSMARACRHCGHTFSEDQLSKQATFEEKVRKTAPFGCAGVLFAILAALALWTYSRPTEPATPQERAVAAGRAEADRTAVLKFTAEGTAGEAVKLRLDNPSSFELVAASAMPGKTDDGEPGWIVGVTYRAANGFGGVVTNNAIVSVDHDGKEALKVIEVR